MPDIIKNSDGSTDVYASPSGLVGAINGAGFWVCWIPAAGQTFAAQYAGLDVQVMNQGNGTYRLQLSGVVSHRTYDSRWLASPFFDATGAPVGSLESARAPGLPTQVYYTPGAVVMTTTPGSGNAAQAQTGNGSATSSSDGRSDVWASDSGMVGTVDTQGIWQITRPNPGVTITSRYGGETITVQNVGGGEYMLTENGATTRRRYASRFLSSNFFDAQGNPVAQYGATVRGDPGAVFFTPGDLVQDNARNSSGAPVVTTPGANSSAPVIVQQVLPTTTTTAQTLTPGTNAGTSARTAPNGVRIVDDTTQGSDGSTNAWAGDSGMIGSVNSQGFWAMIKPPARVVYTSFYDGAPIRVSNRGDGTYQLDADGANAIRRYAARWRDGQFYDAAGNAVASHEAARVPGDPQAMYFTPGPIVTAGTPTTTAPGGGGVTPGVVTLTPGAPNTQTPGAPNIDPNTIAESAPGTNWGKIALLAAGAYVAMKGF